MPIGIKRASTRVLPCYFEATPGLPCFKTIYASAYSNMVQRQSFVPIVV